MISTFQPLRIGVARIHAEEIGREKRRFVAAGAGADFQDRALFVGCILGQKRDAKLLLESRDALGKRRALGICEIDHVLVGRRIRDQMFEIGAFRPPPYAALRSARRPERDPRTLSSA